MSTNVCQSNLTSGFIDLATYDELEKYMYGGPDATAYFVRETRKATWFTQCPVTLARCNGTPEFGAEWACTISRAGDYLLGTWLHVVTPEVSLKASTNNSLCIAWTPNFMHALVKECCITFNDLVAARFDSTHLDFWAAFTTPASKSEGYKKMIGAQLPTMGSHIPSYALNLPLPFFYTRDSGVALPTAALPYNEMRINFVFRQWQEMLMTFREYANCDEGHLGPAMAVEHPETQTNQTNASSLLQQITFLTASVTGPAAANWVVGGQLNQTSSGAYGTIVSGGTAPVGALPTIGQTVNVLVSSAASFTPRASDLFLNGLAVTQGAGGTYSAAVVPIGGGGGFTQVGAQEKVSRVNYAAPFFCKRNCPVVSVAADQLSIGAALNGFEVASNGVVVDGSAQQQILTVTVSNVTAPAAPAWQVGSVLTANSGAERGIIVGGTGLDNTSPPTVGQTILVQVSPHC